VVCNTALNSSDNLLSYPPIITVQMTSIGREGHFPHDNETVLTRQAKNVTGKIHAQKGYAAQRTAVQMHEMLSPK